MIEVPVKLYTQRQAIFLLWDEFAKLFGIKDERGFLWINWYEFIKRLISDNIDDPKIEPKIPIMLQKLKQILTQTQNL